MEVADLKDIGIEGADPGMVACIADSIAGGRWQRAVDVEMGMAVGSLPLEDLVVTSLVIQKAHEIADQQRRLVHREAGQEW
jgi:hypothetical protein